MTGTWQLLRSFLHEAEYHGYGKGQAPKPPKLKPPSDAKEDVFRYVVQRYGEHDADELRNAMRSMKFRDFRDHVASKYMDSQLDARIETLAKSAVAAYRARQAQDASSDERQGLAKGPSGRSYSVDPDAEGERQAKIDAMRQARSAVGSGGQDAAKALMTPGRSGTHAVGSAGQNQPRPQPSIAAGIRPQQSADDLKKMRIGRSGIVRAQRLVDKETRERGQAAGEQLAKKLGVPTTAERTVVDQDTGSKTIQIWGPDRVFKHVQEPATGAVTPFKGEPEELPGFLRGAYASSKQQGASFSAKGPEAGAKSDTQRRKEADPAARSSSPDRIDLIKRGIIQRNAAAGPGNQPKRRPGSFHGERWKPHGREQEVPSRRPDAATGNWMNFKRTVDPKHTGQELIWNKYANDWQTPSVFASQEAERGAKMKVSSGFEQDEPTERDAPAHTDDDEE